MAKLMTQSDYARLRGTSPAYVNKLVKKGIIILDRGKVNQEQADKSISDYADPTHLQEGKDGRDAGVKATQDPDINSFAYWRKMEVKIRAGLKKIEYDEKMGILINAEELKLEFAKLFTDIKTRLQAVRHKCSQEITHIIISGKSELEIRIAIDKILQVEHDEALMEMSKWKR